MPATGVERAPRGHTSQTPKLNSRLLRSDDSSRRSRVLSRRLHQRATAPRAARWRRPAMARPCDELRRACLCLSGDLVGISAPCGSRANATPCSGSCALSADAPPPHLRRHRVEEGGRRRACTRNAREVGELRSSPPPRPSPRRQRGDSNWLAGPRKPCAEVSALKWFELRRGAPPRRPRREAQLVAAGRDPRRVPARREILDAREALARERVEERRRATSLRAPRVASPSSKPRFASAPCQRARGSNADAACASCAIVQRARARRRRARRACVRGVEPAPARRDGRRRSAQTLAAGPRRRRGSADRGVASVRRRGPRAALKRWVVCFGLIFERRGFDATTRRRPAASCTHEPRLAARDARPSGRGRAQGMLSSCEIVLFEREWPPALDKTLLSPILDSSQCLCSRSIRSDASGQRHPSSASTASRPTRRLVSQRHRPSSSSSSTRPRPGEAVRGRCRGTRRSGRGKRRLRRCTGLPVPHASLAC